MRLGRYLLALALFLTIAVVRGSSAGAADPALRILTAFRGQQGDLIVRFEDDPAQFPAGNTVFWGQGGSLYQLELNWNDSAELLFYDPRYDGESVELSLRPDQARVNCGGRSVSYVPLAEPELKQLEASVRSGEWSLRSLPRVMEPLYLFRVKDSQPAEYVFIRVPRFDFHRDYEVRIGRPGAWRRVETVMRPKDTDSTEADLIYFKNGGGIHVPASIELFSGADSGGRSDRGAPTLLRSGAARMEDLVHPDLSPSEIKRLGFASTLKVSVRTPCDAAGDADFPSSLAVDKTGRVSSLR